MITTRHSLIAGGSRPAAVEYALQRTRTSWLVDGGAPEPPPAARIQAPTDRRRDVPAAAVAQTAVRKSHGDGTARARIAGSWCGHFAS